MQECTGLIGSLFGHKFEPRYSVSPPNPSAYPDGRGSTSSILAFMEASKSRTYVYDVCTRCGCTTNRTEGQNVNDKG